MTLQTIRLPRPSNGFPRYRYRGARAMVLLQEMNLREFVATWKLAKSVGVTMPTTTDPEYVSLDTLIKHVFSRSRDCLFWICDQLDAPHPKIDEPPADQVTELIAQEYVDDLCKEWQHPLREVTEERLHTPQHATPWRGACSIQMQLEHAVVHCQRHRMDLSEILVAACR